MAANALGPDFPRELIAAGLIDLPFSWHADGTLLFSPSMTSEQVAAVTAAALANDPAKPDPNAAYAGALAAGCAVQFTVTPALSATYGTLAQDEINVNGLLTGITAGAPWLGWYADATGVKRIMTAPQFQALAAGLFGYVEALATALNAALQPDGVWTPPSQPVVVAA